MLSFELPLATKPEGNGSHGHWAVKAERRKAHRAVVAPFIRPQNLKPVLRVLLVRVSAGTLDDDNLRSALKGVRDGIAARLRIDDGSKLVRWDYDQEEGPRGVHRVKVLIERLAA